MAFSVMLMVAGMACCLYAWHLGSSRPAALPGTKAAPAMPGFRVFIAIGAALILLGITGAAASEAGVFRVVVEAFQPVQTAPTYT